MGRHRKRRKKEEQKPRQVHQYESLFGTAFGGLLRLLGLRKRRRH